MEAGRNAAAVALQGKELLVGVLPVLLHHWAPLHGMAADSKHAADDQTAAAADSGKIVAEVAVSDRTAVEGIVHNPARSQKQAPHLRRPETLGKSLQKTRKY